MSSFSLTGLTCKWDAWNHLVEVKQGATVVGRYEYDGLARRVKKHLDFQSPASPNGIDAYVHYFYNGAWQVLETRRSTSENTGPESLQPQYQYVWSQRYIDAPVLRDENTDADSLCDDTRIYYLDDANFNVTTLVDTVGDAIERYVYAPYGVLTIYDASWSNIRSSSSYDVEYTFTGRRLDGETGLFYYRHRFYHSQLGRFLNRDPLFGQKDGSYQFVGSNPVVHNDSTGLCKVLNFNVNEFDKQCKYYPTFMGGSYGYRFSVTTDFAKPCHCCAFQQYITCGVRVRRFLDGRWGDWWSPRVYGELHEDCYERDGRRWCYGDRNQPPRSFDRYLEDGCIYQHIDQPGLHDIKGLFEGAPPNLKFEIDMHCRVLLNVIDTTNQQVVRSQALDFSCRDLIDRHGVVNEPRLW